MFYFRNLFFKKNKRIAVYQKKKMRGKVVCQPFECVPYYYGLIFYLFEIYYFFGCCQELQLHNLDLCMYMLSASKHKSILCHL